MQATAPLRGAQVSAAALRLFIVALLSAFLLGGAGGYFAKAWSSPASSPSTAATCPAGSHAVVSHTAQVWGCVPGAVAPQPFVTEPAPYSTPSSATCDRAADCGSQAQPTRIPSGRAPF
ncbi:MAG TPA: hypothetical protein VLK30_05085 [Candidatus Limnocylindrales bacterium]|nr:hypothetical protein [Candidatus Limnocylindrales bacterium]